LAGAGIAAEKKRGLGVSWSSGSSRRVILVCEECGERTVLGGPLSVWCSERTSFGRECGRELTLADRLDQQGASKANGITSAARPVAPLYR
jgi:hypothetical protein